MVRTIIGWAMSVLFSIFLIGPSAMGKFLEWEGKKEMMDVLGWDIETIKMVGVVEIIVAILFLIPRTSFVGAILCTAYLGGATATHVRIDDVFFMPIVMGVFMWAAYGLRRPEIFILAIGGQIHPTLDAGKPQQDKSQQDKT